MSSYDTFNISLGFQRFVNWDLKKEFSKFLRVIFFNALNKRAQIFDLCSDYQTDNQLKHNDLILAWIFSFL